jgi:transposase
MAPTSPKEPSRPRGRPKTPLVLSTEERDTLERLTKRGKTAQAIALRARIVLTCAEGDQPTNQQVAAHLEVNQATVGKWRRRFVAERLDGLYDEDRRGAPRTITDDMLEAVVVKTLEETPADATHWSRRSMAKAAGMSPTTIGRIWRAFELKPHLSENFKLSTDPRFIEKGRDIVGLYLDPPERAVVCCVDEKSQIQALKPTQTILSLLPGVPARQSHDYQRHGTTSLFAALDYATHKTPSIKRWLLAHPRFHLHFTPTSGSWLNLVERWFGELTMKKIRRGTHRSVPELERDIKEWIETWNDNPRPYVWVKSADHILESLSRYCERISGAGR